MIGDKWYILWRVLSLSSKKRDENIENCVKVIYGRTYNLIRCFKDDLLFQRQRLIDNLHGEEVLVVMSGRRIVWRSRSERCRKMRTSFRRDESADESEQECQQGRHDHGQRKRLLRVDRQRLRRGWGWLITGRKASWKNKQIFFD